MKTLYGYELKHDGNSYGFCLLYTSKKKSQELMKSQGLNPKDCIEVPYPKFEKDNPVY